MAEPGAAGALFFPEGEGELAGRLGRYFARKDWARAALGVDRVTSVGVRLVDIALLRPGLPGLASVVVDAGDGAACRLHVVLGWQDVARASASLSWPDAVVGTGSDARGDDVLVYEALADPELTLELLAAATGGRERARRARVVRSLVSHASVVYDERLLMKCYRVIEPRPRPEIEMLTGLDEVGFNHLLAPVARWSRGEGDLGLVREFLPSAVEGEALALTSLRDLLARATTSTTSSFEEIGLAGGDLAAEMRRLGRTTAELHVALAEAFGARSRRDGEPGREIRIHGDYHLRRVMRVDAGWLVVGFGDDPLIGAEAGAASQGEARMASPLEDVAHLWVSLRRAADEAIALQTTSTRTHAAVFAEGWVRHNRAAFLDGYLGTEELRRLVPETRPEVEEWLSLRAPELLRDTLAGPGGAGPGGAGPGSQ